MLFITILPVFGVLATSVWVYLDAKQRHATHELDSEANSEQGNESMSPGSWLWVCLLLWVIGFPWYLYTRFKSPSPRGNMPAFLAIAGVLAVGTIVFLLNAKISSEGHRLATCNLTQCRFGIPKWQKRTVRQWQMAAVRPVCILQVLGNLATSLNASSMTRARAKLATFTLR